MKRRNFLSILGAATVAPLLPTASAAGASGKVWGLAKLHAQKHPFVSVLGLSHRLKVSRPEAESLISELARKGMIGPLRIDGSRPVYAVSEIYVPTKGSMIEAARQQRAERAARAKAFKADTQVAKQATRFDVDISGLMAHLRALCAGHGLTMAPAVSA